METSWAWAFDWKQTGVVGVVMDVTYERTPTVTANHEPAVLICSAAVFLVKTSPSPDAAQDFQENAVASSTSSPDSPTLFDRDGWSLRTSPACCRRMADGTWVLSSGRWPTSGFLTSPTELSTLSSSESPSDAAGCSLSDVLEPEPVPDRYYLSARAARGVLRRAEKRGRDLPPLLLEALRAVAESTPQDGGERTT